MTHSEQFAHGCVHDRPGSPCRRLKEGSQWADTSKPPTGDQGPPSESYRSVNTDLF